MALKFHTQRRRSLSTSTWLVTFLLLLVFAFSFFYFIRNGREELQLSLDPSITPPVFSQSSGLYTEPFYLQVRSQPGTEIYYVLNGRYPDKDALKYRDSILIQPDEGYPDIAWIRSSPRWKAPRGKVQQQVVIRAIAVRGNKRSRESSSHFIISDSKLIQISILSHPDSLFGFQQGIYIMGKRYEDKDNYARDNIPLNAPWWEYPANYLERGEDWERGARIMFAKVDEVPTFRKCRVRVHGSATRGYAQKSLRLYFNEPVCMPLGKSIDCYNSLVLRNGGNDWDRAFIRDMLAQEAFSRVSDFARRGTPSELYVNGVYWGVHNLRELQDQDFIALRIRHKAQEITMLDYDGSIYRGEEGDSTYRQFLLNQTYPANEGDFFTIAQGYVDMVSFIDFLILNMFFANTDWPHNNFRVWRVPAGPAELRKWHWLPTDLDYGAGFIGLEQALNTDMLEHTFNSKSFPGKLFNQLMKSSEFRDLFRARFESQLMEAYSSQRLTEMADSLAQIYTPSIEQHIRRWSTHSGLEDWKEEIASVRTFLLERNARQSEDLAQFFAKFAAEDE